jgi:hypothetical protein
MRRQNYTLSVDPLGRTKMIADERDDSGTSNVWPSASRRHCHRPAACGECASFQVPDGFVRTSAATGTVRTLDGLSEMDN